MIRFFVPGTPAPKGSMKAVRGKDGKLRVRLVHDNPRTKSWVEQVAWAAKVAMLGAPPLRGPIELEARFYLPRPKSHYTADGELTKKAPAMPATKPDLDKLLRAINDALERIALSNDSRVVDVSASKRYASRETPPGVHIELWEARGV